MNMTFGLVSLILCVAYVIVSDVVLALNGRPGDTYSEMFAAWSYQYAALPAAWGAISGHWFLTLGIKSPWWGLFMLLGVGAALLVVDLVTHNWLARHTHPGAWFLIGIALGSMFWGQNPV